MLRVANFGRAICENAAVNSNYQWFNRNLTMTLVSAQLLCYFTGVMSILRGSAFAGIFFPITVGLVAGAFGIANEKKWGYGLAVVAAGALVLIPFGLRIYYDVSFLTISFVLDIMFDVALFALLLHPDSRSYQATYFH